MIFRFKDGAFVIQWVNQIGLSGGRFLTRIPNFFPAGHVNV